MTTKIQALDALRPGEEWAWRGEDYSGLEWLDSTAKPTEAEIDAKLAELEAEAPWVALRAERDRRLAACDWVTLRAVDASNDGLGIQLAQVWIDYRQALRDLPSTTVDPNNPVWPVEPA
jgi:hypothetical protein